MGSYKSYGMGTAWGKPIAKYDTSSFSAWISLTIALLLAILFGIFSFFSPIWLIPLLLCIWYLIHSLRNYTTVSVYTQGLIHRKRGRTDPILWDDIVSVWHHGVTTYFSAIIPMGTEHWYSIQLNNGKTFSFDDKFTNIEKLGETIQQEVTGRIFPYALAAFQAGENVSFGALSVSQAGITKDGKALPWKQISSVEVTEGTIHIEKEKEGRSWQSVHIHDIYNFQVFVGLIEQMMELEIKRKSLVFTPGRSNDG